jgi:hypothetical protein
MPAAPQAPISSRALREALLPPPPAPAPERRSRTPQPSLDPGVVAMLPSADELLAASPNVQRLCDSYHRLHRHMVARGRRQKLGIAGLVAGVGVGTVMLSRSSNQISPATLTNLVLAVAAVSCAALALLAMLWMRDEGRLRVTQGDRLMRAVQLSCDLDEDRVEAFRRHIQPTAAFFDCYRAWLIQHPSPDGPILNAIATVVHAVSGAKRRAAAH